MCPTQFYHTFKETTHHRMFSINMKNINVFMYLYVYSLYIYIIILYIHDFTARSFLFSKSSGRLSHLWLHLVPKVHCPFPLHGLCKSVIQRRVFDNLMWNEHATRTDAHRECHACKPWRSLFARHIQILYILTKWRWKKGFLRFLFISFHVRLHQSHSETGEVKPRSQAACRKGAEGSTMLQERITAP